MFPTVPQPGQVVFHPGWQAALDTVEAALAHPGLIVVLGAPGTGKSLLLLTIARRLQASGRAAAVLQDIRSGLDAADVILIDNADRLTPAVLRALGRGSRGRQGRPVVVAGGAGLAARLHAAGNPAVVTATLVPLPPDAAAAFLQAQFAGAGQPAALIQPAALAGIVQRCQGVPQRLQSLAGLAVYVARLGDAPQVTLAHVEQAAATEAGTDPANLDAPQEADDAQPAGAAAAPSLASKPEAPTRHGGRGWATAAIVLASLGAGVATGRFLVLPALSKFGATATQPVAQPPVPERPASLPPSPQPSTLPPPTPAAPVRVVVAYPTRSAGAARRAAGLAADLRQRGYDVPAPVAGPARGEPPVSYAYAEDGPAAAALAHVIGVEPTQVRPGPATRPGAIRVFAGPVPPTLASPQHAGPAR